MKRNRLPLFEETQSGGPSLWKNLQKPTRDPAIIKSFLDDFNMSKATIERDGSVTWNIMDGWRKIEIANENIGCFPIYLNNAPGPIAIRECPRFFSLEGLPKSLNNLSLANLPKLRSLKYCPVHIYDMFWLTSCPSITSLEGFPTHVGRGFVVHTLKNITNLKGMENYSQDPTARGKSAGGAFYECGLLSLEGAPSEMIGGLTVANGVLKTLKGAPRKIRGRFDVSNNRLTSLRYHPKYVWDSFVFKDNPLRPGEATKARRSIKKRW